MPRQTFATRRPAALLAALSLALAAGPALAQPADAAAEPKRTEAQLKKYELDKDRLAIEGYDPVGYFPEGDPKGKGAAIKGEKKFQHTYNGVTYRFSSQKNLDLFKKHPARYEPAHGGWCSYAAAKGQYTEPSPKNFIVREGRLFLFYKDLITDTKKLWDKEGAAKLEAEADAFWNKESGEAVRNLRLDANGNPITE